MPPTRVITPFEKVEKNATEIFLHYCFIHWVDMFHSSKQSRSRTRTRTRTVRKNSLKLLLFASVVLLLNHFFTQPQIEHLGINIEDTTSYVPAKLEKDILDNAVELGYSSKEYSKGCPIWQESGGTELYPQTKSYLSNLEKYVEAVKAFRPIPDLLKSIQSSGSYDVCTKARPHPKLGLEAFFQRNQLSHTTSGYVEPITTPMRDPKICFDFLGNLMSLDFLVHDFEAMCRKLKPMSRRVLIDLGASLEFHDDVNKQPQPVVTLLNLYEKFGFNFDHIYAFEMTPVDPTTVYSKLLPEKYFLNYHWINVGKNKESPPFSFII